MIDDDTRVRFNWLVAKARRDGRDLAEVLDEDGLLATKLRVEKAGEQGLVDLLEAFERRDPTTFMMIKHGRAHGSPQDMYVAIADFVHAQVNAKRVNIPRQGGHRDR